jgi:hypothetical protein|nr:MAG TPA: major tail protein [Caudoviricetes sp.]
MNKMYHAISPDAFKKLQFQAGALLKKFDPTEATPITAEDMICLTSGGITVSCKPNTIDLGENLDEVPENTYQLKHITSWDCGLSTTCMTVSADTIKLELGAADVETGTNKITVREDYKDTDFQDVWWHGNLIGGGYAAVKLMKAVSDGGLELKTTKDGKGNINLSLKGHYDMTDTSKVPMEFYVKEAE